MMDEEAINLLENLLPIFLGTTIGYFLKYYLDKKAQFTSKNSEVKREMYQQFVDLMLSFFITTKSNQKLQANVVEEIAEFYKKFVLYASPKVINYFSDYMQFFYKNNYKIEQGESFNQEETKKLLGMLTKIYKAMRKDIGLSNRGLGRNAQKLMRGLLTDYDEVMKTRLSFSHQENKEDSRPSGLEEMVDESILENTIVKKSKFKKRNKRRRQKR